MFTVELLRLLRSLGFSVPNPWEGFAAVGVGSWSVMSVASRVGVKGTMGESGRTGWVGDGGGVIC